MSDVGDVRIIPIEGSHRAVLQDQLADPRVADGVLPFVDRDRRIGRALEDGDDRMWTILRGEEIVGAVGAPQGALLIFVAAAHQGGGVGRAALDRCLEALAHEGGEVVSAAVARSNMRSRRLLASTGFVENGLRNVPRAREPVVAFWRSLG